MMMIIIIIMKIVHEVHKRKVEQKTNRWSFLNLRLQTSCSLADK